MKLWLMLCHHQWKEEGNLFLLASLKNIIRKKKNGGRSRSLHIILKVAMFTLASSSSSLYVHKHTHQHLIPREITGGRGVIFCSPSFTFFRVAASKKCLLLSWLIMSKRWKCCLVVSTTQQQPAKAKKSRMLKHYFQRLFCFFPSSLSLIISWTLLAL